MRPVDPDAVAHLAAEQLVAGHAERLGLGVEQRVLDGAERLRDDAAGRGPRRRSKLGVDALVLDRVWPTTRARQALDHGADARRAEALVELAPADDAVVGRELDEVVVAPAGVAGERLDASYVGCLFHDFLPRFVVCWLITTTDWQGASIGRRMARSRMARADAAIARSLCTKR